MEEKERRRLVAKVLAMPLFFTGSALACAPCLALFEPQRLLFRRCATNVERASRVHSCHT
jgi:hypothetical protein